MAKVDASNTESGHRVIGNTARDDSDLPPDSIVVPITHEAIWQDLSTAYDSEDSTRGSTNPKSHSNPFPWSKAGSASNRVATTNLNATTSAPIIGLPAKIKRTGFISRHRPPSIFPKGRNSGSKKSGLADSEPGSPKVSCLGHVLSQRERERRRIQRQEKSETQNKAQSVTCCVGFSSFLHCGGDKKRRGSSTEESEVRQSLSEKSQAPTAIEVKISALEEIQRQKKEETKPYPEEVRRSPEKLESEALPPGISAMKRFSSGRRAASWGDDVVAENQGRGAAESN
jgi:hypothetical protein